MKQHNEIRWLGKANAIHEEKFGRKSSSLLSAALAGVTVPTGFCISTRLAHRISESASPSIYQNILASYVEHLLKKSVTKRMIVRSSSVFEDRPGSLFSGLFDSYGNLETTEELISAITKIVKNASRSAIQPYFKKSKFDFQSIHMAILVQEQVHPVISGLAYIEDKQAYVEFSKGHLGEMVSGRDNANNFYINLNTQNAINMDNKAQNFVELTTPQIINCASKLQKIFHSPYVIEFGISDDEYFVFQIKQSDDFVPGACLGITPANADMLFSGSERHGGAKAQAMEFFRTHDLFSKQSIIIKPSSSLTAIERSIRENFDFESPITIRYSSGSNIGLPRAFVKSLDEAMNFIRVHYQRHYAIIVHEYINVLRSFEILIDEKVSLLEHIPGMWESNNTLQPDVITYREGGCYAQLFSDSRIPLSGDGTTLPIELSLPISDDELSNFYRFLVKVRKVILANFRDVLPINIHAVLDGESEHFQCLNIRRGFPLFAREVYELGPPYKYIGSARDLDSWNGSDTLRLGLRTARGSECNLVALAKSLAESRRTAVVDFGLLSHPAMVLREYGVKIVPSYLVPECFDKKTYRFINLKDSDHDYSPVERILREKGELYSRYYHVVHDAEPITLLHYLAVYKCASSPSVKDSNNIEEVTRIFTKICGKEDGLFYERGRASFCTSDFAQSHDHFHVVLGVDLPASVSELKLRVGGDWYSKLSEAYKAIPPIGEYVVFGSKKSGFFVSVGAQVPKRLLRECVIFYEEA